jgi:rhamnogalacturonan endolyase
MDDQRPAIEHWPRPAPRISQMTPDSLFSNIAIRAGILMAAALLCAKVSAENDAPPAGDAPSMKLWNQIDISKFRGTFPCLGDLDGDGRVDFLLYRQGPQTTPGYLVAVRHDGEKLWEKGNASLHTHLVDGAWNEPALRGIALIYDIDGDGKSEVITELWTDDKPMLYVLEGATGAVKQVRESPFDLKVRGGRRSRCHPVGRIAFLEGHEARPSLVLLFGASGHVPCHIVALNPNLKTIWHVTADGKSVAHVPTVGEVDGDGRDEVLCGTLLLDSGGKTVWDRPYKNHADCTAICSNDHETGKSAFFSICNTGPAACLSVKGEKLWETKEADVSHGQGIWVGNFMNESLGQEAIICRSGHRGEFLTVRANDGRQLGEFRHRRDLEGYPDFPCVVNWRSKRIQSLWIPIDRSLVDGLGHVVADLGSHEDLVRNRLQWGTTKSHVATQAFAVDLCGDERDELVLYQPYNGQSVFIFTQPDSDGRDKPFVPQESVYNIQSYF